MRSGKPLQSEAALSGLARAGFGGRVRVLDAAGYAYYFLFTVLDYPREIDVASPPLQRRIAAFARTAEQVGRRRVVWRYDPILLTSVTGPDYHRRTIERLCRDLSPNTTSVVVSLYDAYAKTDRRFDSLPAAYRPVDHDRKNPAVRSLLRDIADCARGYGLSIQGGAGELCGSDITVPAGACIDEARISELTLSSVRLGPDPHQRSGCLCAKSKDIGSYNTCLFDCRYCYACTTAGAARRNHARHDPAGAALVAAE